MSPEDEQRLARVRTMLEGKWDDAAGEPISQFLLRLLDEERAKKSAVHATARDISRDRWKLGLR